MAIGDDVSGVLGGLFSGSLSIVFWIIIGTLGFFIFGGIGYYFFVYKKRFDIKVKVISKRSGENKVFFDKGAVIFDKKNATHYLKLFNTNIELELPKFDIFYHTNQGDYVELMRHSEKDFRFLIPPKVDRDFIIKKDGKTYPMSQLEHRELENDLSWIINREKTNKKLIDPEGLFLKLLAYAPQIISGVLSIMALWIALRYAPELLAAMEGFTRRIEEANTPQVVGSLIPILWKRKI